MPRENNDRRRVHIWIDNQDYEDIHAWFGQNPGFSSAVRSIISASMKTIRKKREAQSQAVAVEVPDEMIGAEGGQ